MKSVHEYVAKFEFNTGRIDSSDEATLIQFFVWGLHRDIAGKLSMSQPPSLFQVIATMKEIELAIKFSRQPLYDGNLEIPVRMVMYGRGVQAGETPRDDRGVVEVADEVFYNKFQWARGPQNQQCPAVPQRPPHQPKSHECWQIVHILPDCLRLKSGRNVRGGLNSVC